MQRCTFEADCRRVPQAKSAVGTSLEKAGANLVTVNAKDRRGIVMGEVGKMHGETITPTSLATIFAAIAATQAELRNVVIDMIEQNPKLPMYGTLGISTKNTNDIGAVAVEIMRKLEQLKLAIQSISVLSSEKVGEGYIACTTQGFAADTSKQDVEKNRDQVLTAIQDVLKSMNIVVPKDATKDIMTLIQ